MDNQVTCCISFNDLIISLKKLVVPQSGTIGHPYFSYFDIWFKYIN